MGDARSGEVTRQQKNLRSFPQPNVWEGRLPVFHSEKWKIENESKIFNQIPNRPERRIFLPISHFRLSLFSTAHSNQPLLQLLQTERLLAFVLQICPSFESLSSYY
jgi:hypothetical protein